MVLTIKDIKPGDLFGIAPWSWWTKLLTRIVGANTFHWGVFVASVDDGWVVSESIGKGAALTMFNDREAFIYRIKDLRFEPQPMHLVSIHAKYGDYPYDWDVAFKTAIWWLFKHYLGKVIPRWHDKEVNCQEWVVLLASELGVKIIPESEYPICRNLENSPYLEYLGRLEN